MGQHFNVVAPKLRQDKGHNPESTSKTTTASATTATTSKKHAHNVNQPAGGEEKGTDKEAHTRPAKRSYSGPHLLTLPAEVHLCVFKLLGTKDLCRLGLTCWYFWSTLKPHIGRRIARHLGVWAGIPVVCIGDDSSADEDAYPQGLLDEDDKDELKEGLTASEGEDSEDEEGPAKLFRLADYRYRVPRSMVNAWFPARGILAHRADNLPESLPMAQPRPKSFYPDNRVWILRNLTTWEFVVSSVALKPEYVRGPLIDGIGFGEIILSRICWSTSNNLAMENKHDIHKGKWAGHQLDIVPLDTLNNDDGSWKDISDEVTKAIAEIWEAEEGENWRERIIEVEG